MKNRSTKTRSIIMGMVVALWAMLSMANDLSARQITISTSRSNSNSTSISQKNGTYRYSSKQGSNGIEIEYEGDIAFTDDDKAIKSISRGGYIKIRKTSFGERRELLAEGNADGTIDYQFYEGRRRADFDAAAQKWLADVLLEAIRATGIGAESRTQRIYAKGGLDAVLKETNEIKSDHVSQMYLKAVLGKQNLSNKELVKIAAYVPANLSSDHYITEVFKDYSTLFLKNNETTEAFLNAIGRMDSDHYISTILMRALKEDLSDAMISKVLDAAERMDSDHYKTEVIKKVMDRKELSSSAVNRIVKATSDIDSDHYSTLILREALDRPNLTDEAFESLMEAISNIDSDHYVTETMRGLLRQSNPSDRVVEAVIKRVGRMDSDHYRTLVINDLMKNQQISKKYFNDLLVTVNDVDSDNYAAQILKSVLREQELSDENYDKVLSRVANIDSDFYKVNILQDVLKARNLNKTHMISILKTVSSIGSDYYKSEVLKGACSSVSGADAEVKDLFRSVAKTIKSDTYYGKVARCID
ncbi:hypothetical protein AWW67_03520 [Roseivirga seohaensis]|uniref:Vitellogenin domain-containing protein n=1 Tax=Roseivirga seohaensis TaxID=1914963 RepID=A0A150XZR9_9BACT|nr:hypothetical protein [Roseivirga seohaensis]KYG84191.1 hypothetical protein AWW67_03520 [Roseivirga seohaensis]